ncbi:hypothetical protein ACUHMQ_19425 [Chitinimonas sp. PSY-7]|uniref:hypothetical protein n=1 Tax=Chitinimonas sp. PSY-7 TaxID=3459088 RepID=UPI00403FF65D
MSFEMLKPLSPVIPANAGIQIAPALPLHWMPVFMGMTAKGAELDVVIWQKLGSWRMHFEILKPLSPVIPANAGIQ